MILRGLFVLIGAAALENFHQVLIAFAIILGIGSYGILFPAPEEEAEEVSYSVNLKDIQRLRKKCFNI